MYSSKIPKHAYKCACSSVSHCMLTVRRSCSSDWLCSQSQRRHTVREWTTGIAWGFWEGLPYITPLCCFAQWLRLCLPQSSDHTTNLSPWLNNQSGMNQNHCLLCVVVSKNTFDAAVLFISLTLIHTGTVVYWLGSVAVKWMCQPDIALLLLTLSSITSKQCLDIVSLLNGGTG